MNEETNKNKQLTPRQKRFCEEYVILLNGTQSALKAGFKKRSAAEQSTRLLKNVKVQKFIAELQSEISERNKLSADMIVAELRKIAFWDIRTFVGKNQEVKDISKLTGDEAAPVVGIKTKKTTYRQDGKDVNEVTTELKLSDKRAALVDLGRHLGVFEKDNDQKGIKIKITRK